MSHDPRAAHSAPHAVAAASIDIPVKNSTEVIEMWVDELPDTAPEDIRTLLEDEETPREIYLRVALAYYRYGNEAAFLELVESGLSDKPYFAQHDKNSPKDRIDLYNALGAYYINQMTVAYDESARRTANELANINYSASDRVANSSDAWQQGQGQNLTTWLGKGVTLLLNGDWDKANYHVRVVTEKEPGSIPGQLAKAALHFHREQYAEALATYQKVLKMAPQLQKPDVRVGIGLCFERLRMVDHAKHAFERALDRDPDNWMATSLLAACHINAAKQETNSAESAKQEMKKGVELLKRAQLLEGRAAQVNIQFAEIHFQRKDFAKSEAMVQQVLAATDNAQVKSMAHYILGKIFHNQMDRASEHFTQAITLDPSAVLPIYSLAQAHLHRRDFPQARKALDKCIKQGAKHFDVEKLLALTMAQNKKEKPAAVALYQRLTTERPDDADCWIALAQLLESGHNAEETIKAYREANILLARRDEFSLQLFNNHAALLHMSGDLEQAEKMYEKAISICRTHIEEKSERSVGYGKVLVTLLYNLGRLYEEQDSRSEKAEALYREILMKQPGYIDAILRIGCILQARGQVAESTDQFKDALGIDEASADTWILIANQDLAKNAHKNARGSFERVLKKIEPRDVYSLLAIGNDKLLHGRSEPKPDVRADIYKEAVKCFDKVLRIDPKNAYAAHGLGIALAETGHPSEAKEVLLAVCEAAPNLSSAQLSLAHVNVELGQYDSAIALYNSVNTKFLGGNDAQVHLHTARAFYLKARLGRTPPDMLEAIACLKKACHLLPQDGSLRFNLALSNQQFAQLVSDLPEDQRSIEVLEQAKEYIEMAQSVFGELRASKESAHKLGYDPQMAAQREKHCDYVRNSVIRRLAQQKANEELKQDKLAELKRARDEEERARQQRAEEERLKREQHEQALLDKRRQMQMELLSEQLKREEEAKRRRETNAARESSKRKRGKKSDVEGDFVVSSDESDGDMTKSAASGAGERSAKREKRESTGEGARQGKKKLTRKLTLTSTDDADTSTSTRKKFALSEDIIRSSDDESVAGDEGKSVEPSADASTSPATLERRGGAKMVIDDEEDEKA